MIAAPAGDGSCFAAAATQSLPARQVIFPLSATEGRQHWSHCMSKIIARALGASLISLMATAASAESFASSASSAGSKSVGSLSDSLTGSSNSSSGAKKVAEGNYRIEQVAEVAGKPEHLRLHLRLQPQAAATTEATVTVLLDLPRGAVERQALGVDSVIALRQRAYGMEVAHQATQTAFFLLLADGWRNDLDTRVVTL